MKISVALTACNDKYSRFIPIFIHYWKTLYPTIKPMIIYVGNLDDKYGEYSDHLIEYAPPANLPTAYVAQTVRLLWPALLNQTDSILISDIDMIPANSQYFTRSIEHLDNNLFVNFRQGDVLKDQIYMCYNAAPPSIWREIFHIYNINDINKFLINNFNTHYDSIHGGRGWYTDQELFYKYFMIWKNFSSDYVFLTDLETKFNRMEPMWLNYNVDIIKKYLKLKIYSDCHLYSDQCPWSEEEMKLLCE